MTEGIYIVIKYTIIESHYLIENFCKAFISKEEAINYAKSIVDIAKYNYIKHLIIAYKSQWGKYHSYDDFEFITVLHQANDKLIEIEKFKTDYYLLHDLVSDKYDLY